ncbi:hypothetical protein MAXJ12_13346 [Mesorhizobium alhagi CCNWXJ12-2]|uniref:Uncharacterized protein n=1 Tax=Mesorhizobium alhagi CCNWXJ12-2 TaxID=1107882 RepID=H0HR84_9HYPH|nr:hypothetical protein MAXJ12_13346 [Mesorhizobium alhagi CCNWXJ12-2]
MLSQRLAGVRSGNLVAADGFLTSRFLLAYRKAGRLQPILQSPACLGFLDRKSAHDPVDNLAECPETARS